MLVLTSTKFTLPSSAQCYLVKSFHVTFNLFQSMPLAIAQAGYKDDDTLAAEVFFHP